MKPVIPALTIDQLAMLIYQHAAHLQAAAPGLTPEAALARAQKLAVLAFDEAALRRGLAEAAKACNLPLTLARLDHEPGGATLALTDGE